MMVKKIGKLTVAWMMVFTMSLTLAGCGSTENTGEDNNRASVTEQNEDNGQQGNDSSLDEAGEDIDKWLGDNNVVK